MTVLAYNPSEQEPGSSEQAQAQAAGCLPACLAQPRQVGGNFMGMQYLELGFYGDGSGLWVAMLIQ